MRNAPHPGETLAITGDFERTRDVVIAAMIFPNSAGHRTAYCMRNQMVRRCDSEDSINLSATEVRRLMDLPSREELRIASVSGVKHGTVAGDLLALIHEQWRKGRPEPSMRSALQFYCKWSVGKKYGDGDAMKYSDMQLRKYFAAAAPAAHLWAAFGLMERRGADRTTFTRDGLLELLGAAKELQDFATTFVPKRAKPAKPIIDGLTMLKVPEHIKVIVPAFGPL